MTAKSKYDHMSIEAKWQEEWAKKGIYKTPKAPGKNKRFVLDMFPYPSAATMHVGHLEGYVGTDILSRYLRMNGYSVLHPMGWDAFGLPAENYAIKTAISPDKSTHDNIKTFKRQLEISGLSYDWDREIDTSAPEFYKWTQWLFTLMFKNGLAYKKKAPVNWCPKDETVLANEQVINGKCERCDTPVIQKELDQWFFKITAYSDRLISGLDKIDWPEEVKVQQKNWIGRSEGAVIKFKVKSSKLKVGEIEVFTTRPDTLFGATFLVLSPESPWLNKVVTKENLAKVSEYIKKVQSSKLKVKSEAEKEKTGVFTGAYAINPATEEEIPIWVADYVLSEYGSGAIMGVPSHDERDKDFANSHKLEVRQIVPDEKIWDIVAEKGWGKRAITFHLRDWLISRQRYWGCPIPMIYCEEDGWQPVPDTDLPVLLPSDVDFLPHGKSPIARSKLFQKGVKCPKCGKAGRREVDTMDTYVDSSWYFIRFVDPKNDKAFASAENIKKWLPVDDYVGGGHVVQHLLFARFFWKVLFDAGLIDKSLGDEPFLKLKAPGWILGPDSRKMSKRWENIITPDDIIPKFGADTLRIYEMFMGPFEVMKPWSITGVEGTGRFLQRVWKLYQEYSDVVLVEKRDSEDVLIKMHQTIKKVSGDIQEFKYNTAVSAMMEFVNLLYDKTQGNIKRAKGGIHCAEWEEALRSLALMLAPFAPHMTEEVWHVMGNKMSIHTATWPKFEPSLVKTEKSVMVVQVNNKVRAELSVSLAEAQNQDKIEKLAKQDSNVAKWLGGKKIIKSVFVPEKLINFVI